MYGVVKRSVWRFKTSPCSVVFTAITRANRNYDCQDGSRPTANTSQKQYIRTVVQLASTWLGDPDEDRSINDELLFKLYGIVFGYSGWTLNANMVKNISGQMCF